MYRCNIGFFSRTNNRYYDNGEEITETDLMRLPEAERRHFIKSRTGQTGSSTYNATPLSRIDDSPSFPSFDTTPDYGSSSSSDSDSSSFGGFDGGDTGGGGASGDW